MSTCPRCHQSVDAQAVTCPYCRTALKAYGHPGIPLYRASRGDYLCDSCTYHEDDSCNFPQRPYAKECTLYHDRSQPLTLPSSSKTGGSYTLSTWIRRHASWIVVLGLVLISLLIALRK